jgi:hypothetical protein
MAGLGSSSSSNPQQEERPRAAGRSSSSRNVAFPEYGVSSFYQHVQPRDSPSSPNPQQENRSRVAGCSSSSPIRGSIPLCESIAGLSPSIPPTATRNTAAVQTNATEEEDDPWADLRSETPPKKVHWQRGITIEEMERALAIAKQAAEAKRERRQRVNFASCDPFASETDKESEAEKHQRADTWSEDKNWWSGHSDEQWKWTWSWNQNECCEKEHEQQWQQWQSSDHDPGRTINENRIIRVFIMIEDLAWTLREVPASWTLPQVLEMTEWNIQDYSWYVDTNIVTYGDQLRLFTKTDDLTVKAVPLFKGEQA